MEFNEVIDANSIEKKVADIKNRLQNNPVLVWASEELANAL